MIRFALFGAGFIGQVHGANIATNPRTKLQYVFDVNTAAAEALAGRFGAKVAGSVDEIWAANDVDAVLIASSTNTHADLLSAAIQAGKPVYCEKPIDMDLDRVKAVVQLAHDKPVPIMMGFSRRFDPNHRGLREVVHNGEVGIVEMIQAHEKVSRADARRRAVEMLDMVGIPQPDRRVDQYTHEFSGGMRQRAMIAMALACNPKLVIADEPTTALDVTVQAQVLEVLTDLAHRLGTAVVLITHDLGVVAGMADQVSVMYAGRIVESGSVDHVFDATGHPYTAGLLASLPRLDGDVDQPLLPIPGQPPSMLSPPAGCSFHPRCRWASEAAGCFSVLPPVSDRSPGHSSSCHRARELVEAGLLDRDGVGAASAPGHAEAGS